VDGIGVFSLAPYWKSIDPVELKSEQAMKKVVLIGGTGHMGAVAMRHLDPRQYRFVVAHLDHGIREDSADDRRFVQDLANNYKLPFVFDNAQLGADASEDRARQARYAFLHDIKTKVGARAIVTAHHQDDLLETAVHNIVRGTGRKGLSSLKSTMHIERPLMGHTKEQITVFAHANGLKWRNDPSNVDITYTRNYIRHNVLTRFSDEHKQQLAEHCNRLLQLNETIDQQLTSLLHQQTKAKALDRQWFVSLPHDVSKEVIAAWLRAHNVSEFDKKTIDRLVVGAKTSMIGSLFDVKNGVSLSVTSKYLVLI
jgi:tRNA(Ile)-lysidine synthase